MTGRKSPTTRETPGLLLPELAPDCKSAKGESRVQVQCITGEQNRYHKLPAHIYIAISHGSIKYPAQPSLALYLDNKRGSLLRIGAVFIILVSSSFILFSPSVLLYYIANTTTEMLSK